MKVDQSGRQPYVEGTVEEEGLDQRLYRVETLIEGYVMVEEEQRVECGVCMWRAVVRDAVDSPGWRYACVTGGKFQ